MDQHIRSLQALKVPIENSNALLVPLFISKLDQMLIHEWERKIASVSKDVLPTYDDFRSFMLLAAETSDITKDFSKMMSQNSPHNAKSRTNVYSSTISIECTLCHEPHFLYQCKRFLQQDISNRIKTVKSLHLCLNCLKKGHFVENCKSTKCKTCHKSHNTLLHLTRNNANETPTPETERKSIKSNTNVPQSSITSVISNCATKIAHSFQTLLSTAEVFIADSFGNLHKARALLDSASQSNFIIKEFVDKWNLTKHDANVLVSGIGNSSSSINHCATIKLYSKYNNYISVLSCLIIDKITDNIPHMSFSKSLFSFPQGISLADEQYNESKSIDILLGANIFWSLITDGQRTLGHNQPILKNTVLGWIISGSINTFTTGTVIIVHHHVH